MEITVMILIGSDMFKNLRCMSNIWLRQIALTRVRLSSHDLMMEDT
jgi:hypothetical protein